MIKTVLGMTQNILSAMDDDEVNSITDSVMAAQVAEVIKETYEWLFSNEMIPYFEGLVKLESLVDVNRPNVLRVPDNVQSIKWIKYDIRGVDTVTITPPTYTTTPTTHEQYQSVSWMSPSQFVERLVLWAGQDDTVEVDGFPQGVKFYIKNNSAPTYWTTFDDEYIFFDSYDASVESTLQQSKSLCFGQYVPVFEMRDDFVPQLAPNQFPLLLAEAKATCFVNFKQVSNAKEEQKSRKLQVKGQNDRFRLGQNSPIQRRPDYGRRHP